MKGFIAAIAGLLATSLAAWAQVAPTPAELEAYSGVHAAVAGGSTSEVERAVRAGADVDARDPFGRTPLMIAAHRRDIAIARALIELGANVNALDHQSYDALTIAAVHDDVEMLRLLLSSGGNARAIVSPFGSTALIAAARRGNAAAAEALIDARAPIEHVDYLGGSALLDAVAHATDDQRYVITVKTLVNAGADLTRTNREGKTPLAVAKAKGLPAIATVLEARPSTGQ